MSTESPKKPFQKFGDDNNPFKNKKRFSGNKFQQSNQRNKRFFQNAKSFAKKSNFGHGTHIEQEDFSYFMGIFETQQNSISQSVDEKVAMANNVMDQTIDKEINLSSNQVVSKVLEHTLGFVNPEHLERFLKIFGDGVRPICSEVYASHVLNKLMEIAFLRAVGKSIITPDADEEEGPSNAKKSKFDIVTDLKYNTTQKFTSEHRSKCSEFLLRISKFLLNNLEDFAEDKCGNHLLRTAILLLAGIFIPRQIFYKGKMVDNLEKYNGSKNDHRLGKLVLTQTLFKVPDEWVGVMTEFPERLQMWPQFKEFPYKNQTSGLLQTICIALNTVDRSALQSLGKKLVKECFVNVEVPNQDYENSGNNDYGEEEVKTEPAENGGEDTDVEKPSVFKSDSAIRLLQLLIAVASPKLFVKINSLFEGRLVALANCRMGCFAVERLINYVHDKPQFEAILDELTPHFENFFESNKASIVSALSATSLRLKTKQAACITALQNALRCNASAGADRPKSFFVCLAKLKPFDLLQQDQRNYVSIYGSLIIQDFLQFNKPIMLVNSILETSVEELNRILQLPNGCFIADTFLTSPSIGEKSREKFIKMFEGFYLDLAVGKSGSRVLELFVKLANDSMKVVIAKELVGRENKLKGSLFGKIVFSVLRLDIFKTSSQQWLAHISAKMSEKIVEKEPKEENDVKEESAEADSTAKSSKKKKKNKKRPAS